MPQPFIGEIKIFAGNFAPAGWMFCDGQLVAISENETLFNLIGTTYGGDGQETFALPDLRGRLPIHQGNGFIPAQTGGVEEVTLSVLQIPAHTHPMLCTTNLAGTTSPSGQLLGITQAATITPYGTDAPLVPLSPQSVGPIGGNQPHSNLQPFLCLNFIISMFGIFPTQS